MMLANYHTHTTRCKHAEGTEREYIEAAIKEGFKILGFSDHTPQPYPEGFTSRIRMDMDEIGNYTETLVKLREEYKDKIQILIGYEVEYTDIFFEPLMKELRQYPLDYIIQGQHFVKNEVEGIYVGRPNPSEEKLKEYVDFTIEGMKTGLFTYLAHPDLFYFDGPDDIYRKHMSKIVEASVDLNIPLEVNFLGFFEGRHYPSERFFKLASEYNPHIVYGCDAHAPDQLLQVEHREGMAEFLKKCNISNRDNNIVELKNCK
ncbi:MAG: histidinol-phosphatase [Lachnospiraceae bacterium]|nr:histidinol-phosphatase [Lachnospiraceae bacterium]